MNPRGFTLTSLLLAACLSLTAVALPAQTTFVAAPYGAPSSAYGPATPPVTVDLVLVDGFPEVHVGGGVPGDYAILFEGTRPASLQVIGNAVLLVDLSAAVHLELFDATGRAVFPVSPVVKDVRFMQGVHLSREANPKTIRASSGLAVAPNKLAVPFDPYKLHLPRERTIDVAKEFATADLAGAVAAMLNSAGDEMTLTLGGEFSVGFVINGGAKYQFQVQVARTDDPALPYEIAIARDLAGTIGVEIAQGIEGNVALGAGGTQIYRFPSLASLSKGIEAVAVLQALAPFVGYQSPQMIADLNQKIADLKKKLSDLNKALDALYKVPKILRNKTWESKVASVKSGIASAKKGLAEAQSLLSKVQSVLSSIAALKAHLDSHRHCVEFRLALSGGIQATLGIPGLTLEGIGLSASFTRTGTVAVRVHPEQNGLQEVVIVRSLMDEIGLYGGFVVSGRLVQSHGIRMVDALLTRNGRFVSFTENTVTVLSDTTIAGGLGVGVAGTYGVARHLGATFRLADVKRIGWQAFHAFAKIRSIQDLENVARVLGSLPGLFSVQDRYVAGLVAKLGASVVGNGGQGSGSALWSDRGVNAAELLTAREALDRLNPNRIAPVLDQATAAVKQNVAYALTIVK